VCISADRKNEVLNVGREVLGYLLTDGKPAIIKENEMEAVKKLTHPELLVVVGKIKPVPGEQVEIKEGPLSGLLGTVLEMSGKKRLVIQLPSLSSMVQIEVKAGNVKLT
jgi:transcription antitermination factor NusG